MILLYLFQTTPRPIELHCLVRKVFYLIHTFQAFFRRPASAFLFCTISLFSHVCLLAFLYVSFLQGFKAWILWLFSLSPCVWCLKDAPSMPSTLSVSICNSDNKHKPASNENHKASPIWFLFSLKLGRSVFLPLWNIPVGVHAKFNRLFFFLFISISHQVGVEFCNKGFLCPLEYIILKWDTVKREYVFVSSLNIVFYNELVESSNLLVVFVRSVGRSD